MTPRRPLVSRGVIDRVLRALDHVEAALPVLPVVDTLKRVEGGVLVGERRATALPARRRRRAFASPPSSRRIAAGPEPP